MNGQVLTLDTPSPMPAAREVVHATLATASLVKNLCTVDTYK